MIYIYIYISMGLRCWPYPKSEIRKFNIIFNHFAQFLRQIRCQIGLQLIRGVPDPIKTIKKLDQRRWPRQNGCGHIIKAARHYLCSKLPCRCLLGPLTHSIHHGSHNLWQSEVFSMRPNPPKCHIQQKSKKKNQQF